MNQKLGHGGQGENIIKNPQNNNDDPAQQHSPKLGRKGLKNQYAEDKAKEDGQPAHAGDGMVVHPPGVLGDIHGPHPEGKGFDHRRGDKGHKRGDKKGGRGQPYGSKLNRHS